jgi:hypothetical protein
VANTFQDQAKDRFRRSEAFLRKAQALIQDDLIYRSALADAVSAIKNMLQGYLLLRIAASAPSPQVQEWQEIAVSNRMPDLLRACVEAGLNLRGVDRDVRRLNTERNQRTHDDPQYLIDSVQAESALTLALEVHKLIRDALRGDQQAPAAVALPRRPAAFGRPPAAAAATATATALPAPASPSSSATKQTPAVATGAANADLGGEDAGEGDDEVAKLPARHRRRNRVWGTLLDMLAAAGLLILGAAVGIGVILPAASAYAPGLVAPVTRLLPTTTAGVATAIPSPSPTPTLAMSGPLTLGSLAIAAPVCSSGTSSIRLTNGGKTTLIWAVGSTESASARFALKQGDAGSPAQFATLAAGKSATIYITNRGSTAPYRVVLTGEAGAVQVVVPSC